MNGRSKSMRLFGKVSDIMSILNSISAEIKQKRYYTRLAARRAKMSSNTENDDVGGKKRKLIPQAPPPPPVPPPGNAKPNDVQNRF